MELDEKTFKSITFFGKRFTARHVAMIRDHLKAAGHGAIRGARGHHPAQEVLVEAAGAAHRASQVGHRWTARPRQALGDRPGPPGGSQSPPGPASRPTAKRGPAGHDSGTARLRHHPVGTLAAVPGQRGRTIPAASGLECRDEQGARQARHVRLRGAASCTARTLRT